MRREPLTIRPLLAHVVELGEQRTREIALRAIAAAAEESQQRRRKLVRRLRAKFGVSAATSSQDSKD